MSNNPVRSIIASRRASFETSNLRFPRESGPHGFLIVFKEYNFTGGRGPGFPSLSEVSSGDTIFLPLPKTITDSTNLNIETTNLGILGENIADIAESSRGNNTVGSMISGMQQAVKRQLPSGSDIYNAIDEIARSMLGQNVSTSHVENLSSQIAFLIRRNLNMSGFNQSANAGLGSVINPKAAITLEGVTLKRHSFQWDLMVSNPEENEMIKTIVQTIKRNSLPEYINLGASDASILHRALFKYPSMVDIFMLGVDSSHYPKYKTSMIQSINLNYTPNGQHLIMKGGKPGSVSLDLQLIEMDIHTSEDYGGNSNSGITDNINLGE